MKKIDAINGLRGVAMFGVIYQHLFWTETGPGFFPVNLFGYQVFPLAFLSNAWVGVNLFFILSGFVLYLPYAMKTRHMDSGSELASFYKRRASRLLPLYYISVLITILFFSHNALTVKELYRDLLLMGTATFTFTVDMWMPKYNIILWSIGIEIWFSVLFPLLLFFTRRISLLSLFIYSSVLGLAVRYVGVILPWFEVRSPYQNALKDSLAGRLDDFVLGMLLCQLYIRRKDSGPVKKPAVYMAAGLVLIWVGCSMWDYTYLGLISKLYVPVITNVFHAGFFLIVTAALSMGGGFGYLLGNRPLQVVGMMSYSLYIWHHISIYLIIGNNDYTVANMTAYFAFILVFSALTYRFIEFGGRDARGLFLLNRS